MYRFLPLFACVALGLGSGGVQAGPLGVASDYNVFVFGDDHQMNTDAEGRVAVGGNAVFTNYGIGHALSFNPNRYDLVVGNDLTYTNGSVFNGSIYVGGVANLIGVSLAGHLDQPPTPRPIDFVAARTDLKNLSGTLHALPANGTTTVSPAHEIVLSGSNASRNVFNVSGTDLAVAVSFTVNAPAGSTVVVNIDGTSDQLKNFAFFINGTDRQHVLFNFFDATGLAASGISIEGTVLAPMAAFDFENGQINGQVIVDSIQGTGGAAVNGEAHNFPFQGNLPNAVPEPGSLALAGAGLLGLVGYGWRRWRQA